MIHGMSALSLPWAPGIRGEKQDDTSVDWGLTTRVRKQQNPPGFWEISFSESVLISEKQNICQLLMVGVMRYNGLIVIPGISRALGPVAVAVFAAVKQCNESMGKAQRRAYHHGATRASCQQQRFTASLPTYLWATPKCLLTCHLETSTQESVSFFLPLVTSVVQLFIFPGRYWSLLKRKPERNWEYVTIKINCTQTLAIRYPLPTWNMDKELLKHLY